MRFPQKFKNPFVLVLLFALPSCSSSESDCTQGARRCTQDVLVVCRAKTWVADKNCTDSGQICKEAVCVDAPCEENTKRCSQDIVQICTQGVFENDQDCGQTQMRCVEGVCENKPCTEGQTQCSGTTVEKCVSGVWQTDSNCADAGQVCEAGVCVVPPCTEAAKKCVENEVHVCQQGSFTLEKDCAQEDQICLEGACVACLAEQKRCLDSLVQTCQDNSWVDGQDCSDDEMLCADGVCVDCLEDQTRCSEDIVQICEMGSWVDSQDCVTSGERCLQGSCVCIDDQVQCQGTLVETCKDGIFEPGEDCADQGKVCQAGSCADCLNGNKRCQANSYQVCAEGVWSELTDCNDQTCFLGECFAEVAYPEDPLDLGPCTFVTQEYTLMDGDRSIPVSALVPEGKAGPFETIVINHGFLISATQYSTLAQHLASWCYLTILNDYPTALSHTRYAEDITFVVQWLKDQQMGDLKEFVATARIGLVGHSMGGKVSFLAELDNPGLVQAIVALDPIDNLQPSVTPERIGDLAPPTLIVGETFSGENGITAGGFTSYCAPMDQNYQQYFDELDSNLEALEVTFFPAMHMSWLDQQDCVACQACVENPDADHDLVKRLTKRYAVAWFELFLREQQSAQSYLWGEEMDADASQGWVAYRALKNPCQPQDQRCYQQVVLTCEDRVWVRSEDCSEQEKQCVEGSCID